MKDPDSLARNDQRVPHRPLTIGRALEQRRDELGLSREGAASAIGVSRSTYSAYASDQRRLSPDSLGTLVAFLGVDLEEILELYGATCVAQARRVLVRGSSAGSMGVERAGIRRSQRSDDMSIVERVYFDAASRSDTSEVVALAPGYASTPEAERAILENPDVKKKDKKGKKKDKRVKDRKKRHAKRSKLDASVKESKKHKSKKHKSKKGR